MKIINYGSLNIDLVYRVPHIVKPGETISSISFSTFEGGKGANQSIALARAGAKVYHAGRIGKDGLWLLDNLRESGVNVEYVRVSESRTGHALIQVDDSGENAIFLYPGTNREISVEDIDMTLNACEPGDFLLLQNEINNIPYLIRAGVDRGLKVCLNPAPMDASVLSYPLDKVEMLVVNQVEAAALAGSKGEGEMLKALAERLPGCEIVLTLGEDGALVYSGSAVFAGQSPKVEVVDTTGAGDTFIGYYLAQRTLGAGIEDSLKKACQAASISVTKPGAGSSIPHIGQVS